MTTISYYWHSENTQKKKKICKANSNPPHSGCKILQGRCLSDLWRWNVNKSWMTLETMMITAELISVMFFQCSPELLKYHEQAPIKIFAEFKQFSFSSCPGFLYDMYQVFQLLFGGQNLGKVCKSTDIYFHIHLLFGFFTRPPNYPGDGINHDMSLVWHVGLPLQAQQCSLSARGHHIGLCLNAAHIHGI